MEINWGLTLKTILEGTGELEHLQVLLRKKRMITLDPEIEPDLRKDIAGTITHPILKELATYLVKYLKSGMGYSDVKSLVHEWIEKQALPDPGN